MPRVSSISMAIDGLTHHGAGSNSKDAASPPRAFEHFFG
jgi:hypothetical protein